MREEKQAPPRHFLIHSRQGQKSSSQVSVLRDPEPNGRHVHPRCFPCNHQQVATAGNRGEYNRLTQDSQADWICLVIVRQLPGQTYQSFHPFSAWSHPVHRTEKKPTPGPEAPPCSTGTSCLSRDGPDFLIRCPFWFIKSSER